MQTITTRSQRFSPVRILTIGLILYACAFAILLRNRSFEPAGAIVVLVLFGGVFPLLAWAATLRAVPLSISVRPSASALIALTGYVILLSLYLIGGPQWIDQHLPHPWGESARIRFFIGLAKKLVVFVIIPFAIFRFGFGYRVRDFGIQREGLRALRGSHLPVVLVVGGAFLCFQYFVSSGGAAFRREHFTPFQLFVGLPLCFVWLFVEAGLVEEFFFRGLVQSHFAAAFKSERDRCDCLLDCCPGSKWHHVRDNLGANEKSLRAHTHSCFRRPAPKFWHVRPNVVLKHNGTCLLPPH